MAPKSEEALRKRKEAKQKKLLLLLTPVLVLLLVIQGPRVLSGASGPEETTAADVASAPATGGSLPAPDPSTAPAPSPAAEGAVAPAPAGEATLPESDLPPAVEEGQLVSFGRFIGKDPFKQQVVPPKEAEEGKPSSCSPGSCPEGPEGGQPGDEGGEPGEKGKEGPPNVAGVDVNGVVETVAVGGAFPTSDPVFRLASIEGESARIGLVTGSFSSGVETIALEVGETVTLISQPDGFRYRIKLLSVSYVPPA